MLEPFSAAAAPARFAEAAVQPVSVPDRYRGIPLGVECAWPAAALVEAFSAASIPLERP